MWGGIWLQKVQTTFEESLINSNVIQAISMMTVDLSEALLAQSLHSNFPFLSKFTPPKFINTYFTQVTTDLNSSQNHYEYFKLIFHKRFDSFLGFSHFHSSWLMPWDVKVR